MYLILHFQSVNGAFFDLRVLELDNPEGQLQEIVQSGPVARDSSRPSRMQHLKSN